MEIQILDGIWTLSAEDAPLGAEHCPVLRENTTLAMDIPGDIHSTLIKYNAIEDPRYTAQTEDCSWINGTDWKIERCFIWKKKTGRTLLLLTGVDTIAELFLNGRKCLDMDNAFSRYSYDATDELLEGENTLAIRFKSPIKEAERRKAVLKDSYPSVATSNQNLIRRPLYQAGLMGPEIITMGITGSIKLVNDENLFVKSWNLVPRLVDHNWVCKAEVCADVFRKNEVDFTINIGGRKEKTLVEVLPGKEFYSYTFIIPEEDVETWNPLGYGKQHLYPMEIGFGSFQDKRMIAFRNLEICNENKGGSREVVIKVNGREIYAKGAIWMPMDLFPTAVTNSSYIRLLQSAADANINMLRVWGGGSWEREVFYDTCDRLGIMVWHDLMFAASTYPRQPKFLESVNKELEYQIRRLKSHPSIVLWCGGSNTFEALNLFEENEENKASQLASFVLFTKQIMKSINEYDPSRRFWLSSPSDGKYPLLEEAGCGDEHFYDISDYGVSIYTSRCIKPRFVSEFGYPSFASLSTLQSFVKEGEVNITSPSFEKHIAGEEESAIILEDMAKNFRFPSTQENLLYLSQVLQAYAISTAVEYWRTLRPSCMGSILWQLNSVWPASDASAIEHGRKQRAVYYALKSSYAPITPIGFVRNKCLEVYCTNDTAEDVEVKISVKFASFKGEKYKQMVFRKVIPHDSVLLITKADISQIKGENIFCYLKASTPDIYRESAVFLTEAKRCALEDPELKWEIQKKGRNFLISVSSLRPAFAVMLDSGVVKGSFSENFFQVRATAQHTLTFTPEKDVSLEEFEKELKVYDLYSASYK